MSVDSRSLQGVALVCAAALSGTAQAGFTDATAGAGVVYLQQVGQVAPNCIYNNFFCEPERMSGGGAVGDIDGDGDLDLFVTRLDAPDILFENTGNGMFSDGTVDAGLSGFDLQSNGAAFVDVENDGDLDLYVVVLGAGSDPPNDHYYLFINNGSGLFTDESALRGASVISVELHRGYSVNVGDYDTDGYADLHTTEWLPGGSFSKSRLLRNLGSANPGHFEDTTMAAGVELPLVDAFSSTFTDLDHDGCPDLAVAGDFGTSRLFWNDCDGTFTDGTVAANVGTDENGMGSTFGDYDGDGDLDWVVTSIHDENETCESGSCNWGYSGNRLYANQGGRVFSDLTDTAGVREGGWGWGAAFFDYDNDGDLDLVMTNGVDFPTSEIDDAFTTDPMRLWRNDGAGVMTEVSVVEGITDSGSGKGLLVFDYDDNGFLDLFVVNNASQPVLYRNDGGNGNGWLRVRTVGSLSNREGLGAWITLRATSGGPIQVREMGTSTHFLAQSERVAHFGLGPGAAAVAGVIVEWPSGLTQGFSDVPRNMTLLADEAACVDLDGDMFCADPDCNDGDPAIHPDAAELCDTVDNDCDGLTDEPPACGAAAGSVPDGHWIAGTPLTLAKGPAGELVLSWGGSCSGADDDYRIFGGPLGSFSQHEPLECSTGGTTSWPITPLPGDRYYLIAPGNATSDGSHGYDSNGAERSGISDCQTAAPLPCAP